MSLELALQENTTSINNLIAAIQALTLPAVTVSAADSKPTEEPVKETKPKPRSKPAAKPEPQAEEPQAEEDFADLLEEVDASLGETGIPQLPAGERNEAYYKANVQPTLLTLAKLSRDVLVTLLQDQFKSAKGNLVPVAQWDHLVHAANGFIAPLEKARDENLV